MRPATTLLCCSLILWACSHGSDGPPPGQSRGSPITVIRSPTTDYEYVTAAASLELGGTLGNSDTPVTWNSPSDWRVWADVGWQNLDTQATGAAAVAAHFVYVPLLGYVLQSITWTTEVSLQVGANHVRITTTDALDQSVGSDEMLVTRLAGAWLPATFWIVDDRGGLTPRPGRVWR
ncbi:MAG: hypothetical protein K8J09_22205 [Planctomycetes bacterium]|nr:hypothetical protein [Planctomycetota bacterium]MCC7399646.1 hypothetical protein [Planctomycetota bacterium]